LCLQSSGETQLPCLTKLPCTQTAQHKFHRRSITIPEKTIDMTSRRLFTTLRILRPSILPPSALRRSVSQSVRHVVRSNYVKRAAWGVTHRGYATENQKGVPVNHPSQQRKLTEAEKERNEMHDKAQYSSIPPLQSLLHSSALCIHISIRTQPHATALTTRRQKVESNLPDEAIQIYQTLLSRTDLTALEKRLASFNLGVIYHRKGEVASALEYWEGVATETPNESKGEEDLVRFMEEMELCAAANMNLGTCPGP